MLNVTEIPIE